MTYKDLFSCAGKVALVTGGAGLIGREIAAGLAEFGATVYSADIDHIKNDRSLTEGIHDITLDITSEEDLRKTISLIMSESSRLDILVNCAYPKPHDWGKRLEDINIISFQEALNDNLASVFSCCRAAAEQMKLNSSGSIINIASIYGVAAPNFSVYEGTEMTMPAAYSAIKGGLIALTRYFATYYAGFNIRANTISPGGIYDNQPEDFVNNYSNRTPLGRMARAYEVVGAAVYLASEASTYVTGSNIMVDGGWTSW